MLRVAVPNKGQLAEPARSMLTEAGYLRSASTRELVVRDRQINVEFFFLRPRDIAIYVGEGTLDVGITGRDMLLDSAASADEVLSLGFAPSSFRLAAPGAARRPRPISPVARSRRRTPDCSRTTWPGRGSTRAS